MERIRQRMLKRFMTPNERKHEEDAKPAHIADSDFDKAVNSHPLALIDFWASWCGPCQALAPTIEKIASEYAGKVFVGKLNVDENPETAKRFQVFSIPTLLIMKSGKEIQRIVGCVPKEQIDTFLKSYMV